MDLIKAEATAKAFELDGIDAAVMTAMADDTTDAIKNVNVKIEAVGISMMLKPKISSLNQFLKIRLKKRPLQKKMVEMDL